MTSSGLEWDYYEFQPVETSSLEYETPRSNSFLLPANPASPYWNPGVISDWSMSVRTAHTSEIDKGKVALGKEVKEEKDKKKQRRKARKDHRRLQREKEVSTLNFSSSLTHLHVALGRATWHVKATLKSAWLHVWFFLQCFHQNHLPTFLSHTVPL